MRFVSKSALSRGAQVVLLVLACGACRKEPSRWDEASQTAKSANVTGAPTPEKTEGSKLNAFFPADGVEGYKRVFTQEKDGFVEAKLSKDGAPAATLAISDTTGDDAAKKKFEGSSETVLGKPLVTVGKNQSAVLVGRFQIKVSSPTLDAQSRKALLEKFDVQGLGKL